MSEAARRRTAGCELARVLQGHAARGAAETAPGGRGPDRALRGEPADAVRALRGAVREHRPRALRLKPLVAMLCEALEAPRDQRSATAPCSASATCRCSSPASSRAASPPSSIDIDYHIAMGGRAYGVLAESTARGRGRVLGGGVRRAVRQIPADGRCPQRGQRERAHAPCDRDILRLYEIWLKTGSARCYAHAEAPRRRSDARRRHRLRALSCMLLSRLQGLIGGIYDVQHRSRRLRLPGHRPPAACRRRRAAARAEEELLVGAARRGQR